MARAGGEAERLLEVVGYQVELYSSGRGEECGQAGPELLMRKYLF